MAAPAPDSLPATAPRVDHKICEGDVVLTLVNANKRFNIRYQDGSSPPYEMPETFGDTEKASVTFLISSHVAVSDSFFFKSKLLRSSKENNYDGNFFHVHSSDWGEAALLRVFQCMHGLEHLAARVETFGELARLTAAADFFDCRYLVFDLVHNSRPLMDNFSPLIIPTSIHLLSSWWSMGWEEIRFPGSSQKFRWATDQLIEASRGLVIADGLPLPPWLLGK